MGFYRKRVSSNHNDGSGCWVGRIPKRFLSVTRWREYLSSGENRAGCADIVGMPLGSSFCSGCASGNAQGKEGGNAQGKARQGKEGGYVSVGVRPPPTAAKKGGGGGGGGTLCGHGRQGHEVRDYLERVHPLAHGVEVVPVDGVERVQYGWAAG